MGNGGIMTKTEVQELRDEREYLIRRLQEIDERLASSLFSWRNLELWFWAAVLGVVLAIVANA